MSLKDTLSGACAQLTTLKLCEAVPVLACLPTDAPFSLGALTHLDPPTRVDDERHCAAVLCMKPGQVSHRRPISLRVPLWRQVPKVMRPGWREWVHVRHPKHWPPYVRQRHQACTARKQRSASKLSGRLIHDPVLKSSSSSITKSPWAQRKPAKTSLYFTSRCSGLTVLCAVHLLQTAHLER